MTMLLSNNEYKYALNVSDNWETFNKNKKEFLENLTYRFNEKLAKKIYTIIDCNWSDFEGQTAIVIEVEGTKCLTWVIDEFTPIECAEKVFPFDENQIYPQQRAEQKLCFKRYY